MHPNKALQILKDFMARKKILSDSLAPLNQMRVELISVESFCDQGQLRIQEIRHLVTRFVMLGKKRGRPSKKNQEFEDAA